MTYQIFIQALLPALMTAILGGITSAVTMFVMMRTKIFDHDQRLKRIEDRDIPNHLALLLGESGADIGTFRQPSHTDGTVEYAVAHTVVKDVFLTPTQTGTLPETPPHAEGLLDREAAQRAFDSLSTPGGLLMAVDVEPRQQFVEWGLEPIETEV